jgi:hypothetical protein
LIVESFSTGAKQVAPATIHNNMFKLIVALASEGACFAPYIFENAFTYANALNHEGARAQATSFQVSKLIVNYFKIPFHFCEDCRIFCEGEWQVTDNGYAIVKQQSANTQEWEQHWQLNGHTGIVGPLDFVGHNGQINLVSHSSCISLIGHSGLARLTGFDGLIILIDFIGLDALIGLVGFIGHNGLTSLIGLIGLITGLVSLVGLIDCIGHIRCNGNNSLAGQIGLIGCNGLIGCIKLVNFVSPVSLIGLISFIGLGLAGFIGLGLASLILLIGYIIGSLASASSTASA